MDFRSIVRRIAGFATRSVSWDTTDALDLFGRRGSKSAGQLITPDSALSIMAVYAAVRIIAEGMGSLPVHAYRKDAAGDFSVKMRTQPKWLEMPNRGLALCWQDILSQSLTSLLLRGNAYLFIWRDKFGQVTSLEVLDPDAVAVRREGGFIIYNIAGRDHTSDSVLHVRGLALPGSLVGLDPISHAAATMGTALAAQEYGANFFENASLPSGFIGVPGNLSDVGATLIRKAWDTLHSGVENVGTVAVLTEGAEFKPLALSPEQTQFLETRQFSVQDIARLFGLPPHVLADSSNSTSWGSGLAEQNTAMSKLTFTPWAKRLEVAFTLLLRSEGPPRANANTFIRIHLEGFERGSYSDRIETYAAGITAGIYDPDEIRKWEDLPPMTPEQREKLKPPPPPTPPPSSEGDAADSDEETDS